MLETLNHFFSKPLYAYQQTWIEKFLESNPILQESFKLYSMMPFTISKVKVSWSFMKPEYVENLSKRFLSVKLCYLLEKFLDIMFVNSTDLKQPYGRYCSFSDFQLKERQQLKVLCRVCAYRTGRGLFDTVTSFIFACYFIISYLLISYFLTQRSHCFFESRCEDTVISLQSIHTNFENLSAL